MARTNLQTCQIFSQYRFFSVFCVSGLAPIETVELWLEQSSYLSIITSKYPTMLRVHNNKIINRGKTKITGSGYWVAWPCSVSPSALE